jgi:hypothetical protein
VVKQPDTQWEPPRVAQWSKQEFLLETDAENQQDAWKMRKKLRTKMRMFGFGGFEFSGLDCFLDIC